MACGKPGARRVSCKEFAQARAMSPAQARPSWATLCPCATRMSFVTLNTTLLWATLLWACYFSFLCVGLSSGSSTSCTSSSKVHRSSDIDWFRRYKKNCLWLCLDETHAFEMDCIRSRPPFEMFDMIKSDGECHFGKNSWIISSSSAPIEHRIIPIPSYIHIISYRIVSYRCHIIS